MQSRRFVLEVVDDDMAVILRQKTPAQRLSASFDMWRFAHNRLTQMLRLEHPDWDEKDLRDEIKRRMLGST